MAANSESFNAKVYALHDTSAPGNSFTHLPDLTYAVTDERELVLDLYLPAKMEPAPPLVVWIHGGGWRGGSHSPAQLAWLTDYGYAVASIRYRLSQEAPFPAQIHDSKGAIRWLRAQAAQFGYDPDRVAVAGESAGGMLAALIGTSAGIDALEGQTGGHLEQSSDVQAVIDYYGASDFLLRATDQPKQTDSPGGVVYQLLGGAVGEQPELARSASAAFHVSPAAPPLLVLHGARDRTVLPNQSERLVEAYRAVNLPVEYIILQHAGHGGNTFMQGTHAQAVLAFLSEHLEHTDEPTDHPSVLRLNLPDLTSSDNWPSGGQVQVERRRDGKDYLRLIPPVKNENNNHARLANQKSLSAGVHYELSFEMQVAAEKERVSGEGELRITFGALPESGIEIEPSTIDFQSFAKVTEDWKAFRMTWKAERDYAPGEFRIELSFHDGLETILLRSIEVNRTDSVN